MSRKVKESVHRAHGQDATANPRNPDDAAPDTQQPPDGDADTVPDIRQTPDGDADGARSSAGASAAPDTQPSPHGHTHATPDDQPPPGTDTGTTPSGRGKRATRTDTGTTPSGRGKRAARKAPATAGQSDPAPGGRGKRAARRARGAAGRLVSGREAGGQAGSGGADGGRPVSLAAEAYRAIRDQLVMLELPPGTPINDERLARDLGMGRTPVREALKRLETERLVVTFPRRGTFATEVNITDLAHIFEVRQHLEPAAAASAAARATAADRALLEELLEGLDADHALDEAPEPLMALDMRVHRAIYAATHNPYFEDTLVLYDNLATRIWCLFVDRLPDLAGHVGDHSPLLLAVIDGDAEKAAELARDHVVRFERAIRAVI